MTEPNPHAAHGARLRLCRIAVVLWLPLFWVSVATPFGSVAAAASGAAQGLLLLAIVVLHASVACGWRGFFAYLGIAVVVTFLLEASSIATGFPFGFYVHHGAPGPAPLGVPVSVMAGYVVLGWFAWMLAKLIVARGMRADTRVAALFLPLVGGFILAGFDYPYDPIGATVRGMWSFREPSGQFGVPLTNYLGWIFTGWAVFQLFSLVEARVARVQPPDDRRFWAVPVMVWLGLASQYPILYATAVGGTRDVAGSRYAVMDIFEAAVAGSLFSQVLVVLLAVVALFAPGTPERESGSGA